MSRVPDPVMTDVTLEELERRLRILLPEDYQDRYDAVQPVSMGSAGLKYGADGRVAWNEMWASFCDLAMAGGPPHKGALLEPAVQAELAAEPARVREVIDEMSRGIALVTGLEAERSPVSGWIRVYCANWGMAEWMLRAITMENVSVRCREGATLDLPVGPAYRVEKEVKNVITVVAKTHHYWTGHMPDAQRRAITGLLAGLETESPLVQPHTLGDRSQDAQQALRSQLAEIIRQRTGLQIFDHAYTGWLGLEAGDVRAAIWMMRLFVAGNVLARRQGTVVFVPVNPASDPEGAIVGHRVAQIYRFARSRGVL